MSRSIRVVSVAALLLVTGAVLGRYGDRWLRTAWSGARMYITGSGGAAKEEAPLPAGRWRPAAVAPAGEPGSGAADEEFRRRLATLGYLAGHDPAPERSGVTFHDPARAQDGLNLVTSGHAAMARLMDMDGNVLHTWQREFHATWPEREKIVRAEGWRRAHLLPGGDLLAIHDGLGLVKLDARSRVIWASDRHVHHDLDVLPDGTIYTLTWKTRQRPDLHAGEPILDDNITVFDAGGRVLRDISLLDAVEASPFAALVARRGAGTDIFHTNTIEVLDGRHAHLGPAFRRGNIMVAIRYLDTVAIVDARTAAVVWAVTGLARWPHQPTLVGGGNLLLFDNLGPGDHSQVLEIDPLTFTVAWRYAGTAERPLFSEACGSAQRLANGNTLITESDRGRALEVDGDGNLVWEYVNPARAGADDELIATLYEVVRLPPDLDIGWADPESSTGTP